MCRPNLRSSNTDGSDPSCGSVGSIDWRSSREASRSTSTCSLSIRLGGGFKAELELSHVPSLRRLNATSGSRSGSTSRDRGSYLEDLFVKPAMAVRTAYQQIGPFVHGESNCSAPDDQGNCVSTRASAFTLCRAK